MPYSSICISSGHGKFIRGASGSPVPPMLDEVDEARRVVDRVAQELRQRGVIVHVFHDDTSHDQQTNLNAIVAAHNNTTRQLDVSVHFNAFDTTAHGTEVLWVTQEDLADELSAAIADAGSFFDRGGKKRTDLKFLNSTEMPAVLIETCFCDNAGDSQLYRENFEAICAAIVDTLSDEDTDAERPPPPERPEIPGGALFHVRGKCSTFGGPDDLGVSPSEGLAFISDIMQQPELFLPYIPSGTSGLARRLNQQVHYVACRWDYERTPKPTLLEDVALVRASRTGIALTAFPADWGPAGPESDHDTGRVADLSPGLMRDLGITTDDEVEVVFPYREGTS